MMSISPILMSLQKAALLAIPLLTKVSFGWDDVFGIVREVRKEPCCMSNGQSSCHQSNGWLALTITFCHDRNWIPQFLCMQEFFVTQLSLSMVFSIGSIWFSRCPKSNTQFLLNWYLIEKCFGYVYQLDVTQWCLSIRHHKSTSKPWLSMYLTNSYVGDDV